MRSLVPIALLLSSCSGAKEEAVPIGSYFGVGRNALCIAGEAKAQRAGLIAYGPGDTNCSASGSLARSGQSLVLTPKGDTTCRIVLAVNGETVRIGEASPGCAYYCGPGASMTGQQFALTHEQGSYSAPHDFGGDALC